MNDIKLLVLRPGSMGEALADSLSGVGCSAKHAPTLAIHKCSFTVPGSTYDSVIFISPTSVLSSPELHSTLPALTDTVIAVGSGTALQLQQVGIEQPLIPGSFNSEGLLAMPELQYPAGKRILIVKGVGGRPLLLDTLSHRGAVCDVLDVYEREPITITAPVWHWFWQGDSTRGLTVASVETLSAFENQRQELGANFPDFILVASDRIAEVAMSLGYTDVRTVGGAANHLFITAMEHYIKAHD